MEKSPARSYRSNGILGKLYDMVDGKPFDCRENYTLHFDTRILQRFQLGNDVLKKARRIKSQYDIAMRRIMGQLEIRTEFEVWTTFILSKPRVGTDYKVQEKVGRESAGLKNQFRDLCIKAAGGRDFDTLAPFIAAMYRVTWEELRIALHETRQPHVRPDGKVGLRRITARSMPLITFPWLFPDELGRIATGSERGELLVDLGFDTITTNLRRKVSRGQVGLGDEDALASMDCTRTSDGQLVHRGEILHLFRHSEDEDEDGLDPSGDSELSVVSGSDQGPQTPDKTGLGENDLGSLVNLLELNIAAVEEENDPSGLNIVGPSTARSAQRTCSLQSIRDDTPDGNNTFTVIPDLLTSSPVCIVRAASETDTDTNPASSALVWLSPVKHPSHTPKVKAATDILQASPSKARDRFPSDTVGTGKQSAGSVTSGSDGSWEQLTASESVLSGEPVPAPLDLISLPADEPSSPQKSAVLGPKASAICLISTVRDLGVAAGQAGGMYCAESSTAKDEVGESGSDIKYEEETVEVEAETAVERAVRFATA